MRNKLLAIEFIFYAYLHKKTRSSLRIAILSLIIVNTCLFVIFVLNFNFTLKGNPFLYICSSCTFLIYRFHKNNKITTISSLTYLKKIISREIVSYFFRSPLVKFFIINCFANKIS